MIKVNITQDCSDADLSHIETLKQIAINSYKDNGIYLSKIRVSRLGDGLYAYQRYTMPRSYKKKIIVEDTATYTKFYRKNCTAYSDWLHQSIAQQRQTIKALAMRQGKKQKIRWQRDMTDKEQDNANCAGIKRIYKGEDMDKGYNVRNQHDNIYGKICLGQPQVEKTTKPNSKKNKLCFRKCN